MDIRFQLSLAFVIRLGLLSYGEWQDRNMEVKFTDVDYQVYTDAAIYVAEGVSPYRRATYRYTPLLAWLLVPNIYVPMWGKILFILGDLASGYLIFCILGLYKIPHLIAKLSIFLWLYNPLVATISCRGNAESLVSTLVLWALYLILKRRLVLAGIVYGLSIHFKIYPIIFSVALYFSLSLPLHDESGSKKNYPAWFKHLLRPNASKLTFTLITVMTVITLTLIGYLMYGDVFINEAYLYHIRRKDVRHNMSVYFYMLYLTRDWDLSFVGLVTFIPQALLLLTLTFKYHLTRDIPFCLFTQTFIFVAFNKVLTSQYFVWFMSLLPLIVPHVSMEPRVAVTWAVAWFAAQGLCLFPAYLLEFKGVDTFIFIWLGNLIFFVVNIAILCDIVRCYKHAKYKMN